MGSHSRGCGIGTRFVILPLTSLRSKLDRGHNRWTRVKGLYNLGIGYDLLGRWKTIPTLCRGLCRSTIQDLSTAGVSHGFVSASGCSLGRAVGGMRNVQLRGLGRRREPSCTGSVSIHSRFSSACCSLGRADVTGSESIKCGCTLGGVINSSRHR